MSAWAAYLCSVQGHVQIGIATNTRTAVWSSCCHRCGADLAQHRHGRLPPISVAETPQDDPWLASATGPLTVDVCDCEARCECAVEAQ